jgi:predicted glycoside hydrolase/deacetylase ChbG (UPF0249 family)
MSDGTRELIVNADDFGRSDSINAGVVEGHEHGIVTSASLMVRWPSAADAARYARSNPALSVGLHFDLGEWLFDGEWRARYEVLGDRGRESVEQELADQLETFTRLLQRAPTHLDSHQHVHLEEPARSALRAAGDALGVPVRALTPGIEYCGAFYGQSGRGEPYPEGISVEHLIEVISGLPPGVTELGCHPAAVPERASSYAHERPIELMALCDPRVIAAARQERMRLCSFAELN